LMVMGARTTVLFCSTWYWKML